LTVVDLPRFSEAYYSDLRDAVGRACALSDSLIVVCGYGNQADEELWARQLGVWAYLPEAGDPKGLELIFDEARQAVGKSEDILRNDVFRNDEAN